MGQVNKSGTREYRLALEFVTGEQRRQRLLIHEDCTKLTEAAALVMAMAIDPERVQVSESSQPRDRPQRHGAGSKITESANGNRAKPAGSIGPRPFSGDPARASHVYTAVAGWAMAGVLPGLAPGLSAEAGLNPVQFLRLGITGNYGFASSKTLPEAPGAQVSFSMWSLGARTCCVHAGKWELATCAIAEIGRITGQGVGVERAATATDAWAALSLGVQETRYLTDEFGLTLGAQLGASILQPRFGVEGLGEVYRPSNWMVRAGFGLVTLFP